MPKAKDLTNSLSALPKESIGSAKRVKESIARAPHGRRLAFDPLSFVAWFCICGLLFSQIALLAWLVVYV